MDMTSLLSETASSVAAAANAMTASETPSTVGLSCTPLAVGLPSLTSVVPTLPAPTTSTARLPVVGIPSSGDEIEEEFDEDNPEWGKWNCNQIRTKIRDFLGTKEMTQAAFLKLCDINSNSYYRFMNLKGPYGGCDNQTYEGAAIFFYRREKKQKEEKASSRLCNPRTGSEKLLRREKSRPSSPRRVMSC